MIKPLIGITPQYDYDNNFIRIQAHYLEAISTAGGIPFLLPLDTDPNDIDQIIRNFDGFLFPGGPDIDPLSFGEETIPEGGIVLPKRDRIEKLIFESTYKTNKPLFGICRGLQAFNIFLKGTIYQDIGAQYDSSPRIGHYQKSADEVMSHTINIRSNSILDKLLKKTNIRVNSFHHQAINELAPSLEVAARSPDNLIEAAYSKSKPFLLGVQWHPEHLYSIDQDQFTIFKAFIDNCIKYKSV